jgi:hypothetical protein
MSRFAACALDTAGLEAQGRRYARLAADVERLERTPESLTVEFREGFDAPLLNEALAIERECCPFFVLELDDNERRLRAGVRADQHLPALDALADALGG